ncbi:MAG: FHA domain-containing protein [Kiritimatiellae bacterium]|nr:FHA domain-containing protein [Kiritimatiellia bacterium]
MYALHILSGPWKGKRVTVREPNLVIGRDAECHLRLPDDEISRKHAVIEERPDGLTIRDLGSLNGFQVHQQTVREARLQDGALLEIGRTRLQFRVATAQAGPSRRRVGWLQGWTAVAVAAVLIGQLLLLVALSMRGMELLSVVEKTITIKDRFTGPRPAATGDVLLAEARAIAEEPVAAPEPGPVSNELTRLRADVEDLRRQVAEAAAPVAPPVLPPEEPPPVIEPPAAVEPVPEAVPAIEPTPAPELIPEPAPPEDPLIQRAKAMLGEAAAEIQKVNFLEADQMLERIQIMAPDFLPAYIERSRLYEQRGLLNKAGEQWAIVLQKSIGTPLYEQAAAERIRLARAAAAVPPPATPSRRAESAVPERRLPRRIRIASMEQEKLPTSEGYEEMRLLRVAVRSVASERQLDPDDIRIAVTFFDEELTSREIVPTSATVPRSPLPVVSEGASGAPYTVTATYMLPAGRRAEDEKATGKRLRYYGFAVRVYYREELQDEGARPKSLLEKVRTLPTPFHSPSAAAPAAPVAVTNAPAPLPALEPDTPPAAKTQSRSRTKKPAPKPAPPSDADEPVGR